MEFTASSANLLNIKAEYSHFRDRVTTTKQRSRLG